MMNLFKKRNVIAFVFVMIFMVTMVVDVFAQQLRYRYVSNSPFSQMERNIEQVMREKMRINAKCRHIEIENADDDLRTNCIIFEIAPENFRKFLILYDKRTQQFSEAGFVD